MNRMEAIACVLSVCADHLRLSQAKALSRLVAAAHSTVTWLAAVSVTRGDRRATVRAKFEAWRRAQPDLPD